MVDATREQLSSDIRHVLDDVQGLLTQAAESTGQQAHELRLRATEKLQGVQSALGDLQHAAAERSRDAVHATDDWVHTHPWAAMGIGASVGFLLGMLISRS